MSALSSAIHNTGHCLEKILSSVLDRRQERAERRTTHIAELRKRASEADAKLKRLYDAIKHQAVSCSWSPRDRRSAISAVCSQARSVGECAAR